MNYVVVVVAVLYEKKFKPPAIDDFLDTVATVKGQEYSKRVCSAQDSYIQHERRHCRIEKSPDRTYIIFPATAVGDTHEKTSKTACKNKVENGTHKAST